MKKKQEFTSPDDPTRWRALLTAAQARRGTVLVNVKVNTEPLLHSERDYVRSLASCDAMDSVRFVTALAYADRLPAIRETLDSLPHLRKQLVLRMVDGIILTSYLIRKYPKQEGRILKDSAYGQVPLYSESSLGGWSKLLAYEVNLVYPAGFEMTLSWALGNRVNENVEWYTPGKVLSGDGVIGTAMGIDFRLEGYELLQWLQVHHTWLCENDPLYNLP